MKVTLITHTPDPERIIASAARLCYSDSAIEDLLNGMDSEKAADLVERLAQMGHESPIEHISFTFGIEGVSRSLLSQITRHRIASFSVQSQRYVKADKFSYVIPPEIAKRANALDIYNNAMKNAINAYNKLADILEQDYFAENIESGADEKSAKSKAEKKAIEDARFVLPNSSDTQMVATFNARSLLNFFKLRCCARAQWEIKGVADEMLRICTEVAPTVFKNAGPACVRGACDQGRMTCGRPNEVRAFYKELKAEAKAQG